MKRSVHPRHRAVLVVFLLLSPIVTTWAIGVPAGSPARAGTRRVEVAPLVATSDTLKIGILPAELSLDPGDTLEVDIAVLATGPQFNAYDAVIAYDPSRLTFLEMVPQSDQEGPLMTEACANRFHIFTIAADSTELTVNHALLCAGVSVTGPGVVYRLRFRCGTVAGTTEIRLLDGAGETRFYNDGFFVLPMVTHDAQLVIGEVSGAPSGLPAFPLQLGAAPNPFNPRTSISFALPAALRTNLRIHALDGRLVRTIVAGHLDAGDHVFSWDGRDRRGNAVPSGLYKVRLDSGPYTATCSVTLVR